MLIYIIERIKGILKLFCSRFIVKAAPESTEFDIRYEKKNIYVFSSGTHGSQHK